MGLPFNCLLLDGVSRNKHVNKIVINKKDELEKKVQNNKDLAITDLVKACIYDLEVAQT